MQWNFNLNDHLPDDRKAATTSAPTTVDKLAELTIKFNLPLPSSQRILRKKFYIATNAIFKSTSWTRQEHKTNMLPDT